jgi:hypothetical protein
MALELHHLTREYVWWEVTTPNDLTPATAEVAFTAAAEIPSSWESATLVQDNDKWYVRVLASGEAQGGDIELSEGDHQAWIRLTDNPERPVRKTGIVTVL